MMKIELTPVLSEEVKELLMNLTETSANEYSETLTLMLEVFLNHAEVDRTTLANTASLTNKLIMFLFNVEQLRKQKKVRTTLTEQITQCLHS